MALAGGCYEGGQPAHYVRAKPDTLYKFDWVPIEIRSRFDPYVALAEQGYVYEEQADPLMMQLTQYFTIAALVFGFLTLIMFIRAKASAGDEGKALRA